MSMPYHVARDTPSASHGRSRLTQPGFALRTSPERWPPLRPRRRWRSENSGKTDARARHIGL